MKSTTPLLICAIGLVGMVAVLGACTPKPQGLFAENSAKVVSAPANQASAPHYLGRWTVGAGHCDKPLVIKADTLNDGVTDCRFAKVDSSTAGYTISAMCHAGAKDTPSRLTLILPDPRQPSSMTLSGGPYKMPVALERCS